MLLEHFTTGIKFEIKVPQNDEKTYFKKTRRDQPSSHVLNLTYKIFYF